MQYLTKDEIVKLIREIPNERQKLMIAVGFLHALRVSELISLTKANIRDGYVTVQRLKGSMKTTQPFVRHPEPELNEADRLTELAQTLKQHERLFPMTRNGVLKLMQRAGKRAGIPAHKLHPHALKHACAMETIDKIGIQRVRQYLGHRSIQSTGEYLKESDESASKAFAAAMS
jgi:integrase